MSNVVQFPRRASVQRPMPSPTNKVGDERTNRLNGFLGSLIATVWVGVAILWPLLRLFMAIDVVYQFGKMLWFWDKHPILYGLFFFGHFMTFAALHYFVAFYQPQKIKF